MDGLRNLTAIITKHFTVDEEAIEELRVILEHQNGRKVTHDEAEAVGRKLINVVETLANGRKIIVEKEGIDGA